MTTLKTAKRIKLFDENGNELKSYKAIANEEKETEIFSVVKNGYTIIQHQDVVDVVNDVIQDKNLDVIPQLIDLNDGGRLHMTVTFPKITLDVESNGILASLHCTYDNSYDGSTGLRLGVGARLGNTILWIADSKYYHRHTKSVCVSDFSRKLDKGIESFQTKIKDHFMKMFKTPVIESSVLDFLDDIKDFKGVTKTYVDSIISKVKQSSLKNKWQLYCLICEVISNEAGSIDVRDRQLKLLIGKMHQTFKSNNPKITATPENSGGSVSSLDNSDTVSTTQMSSNSPVIALSIPPIPVLTVCRINKRKFKVMMGNTEIKTFRRQKLAQKFIRLST